MSTINPKEMVEGVRVQLEERGVNVHPEMLKALEDALARPGAAERVREIMAREANSVRVGDPAPDFSLPRLHDPDGERVTLSDRFEARPVALIFGSYT